MLKGLLQIQIACDLQTEQKTWVFLGIFPYLIPLVLGLVVQKPNACDESWSHSFFGSKLAINMAEPTVFQFGC